MSLFARLAGWKKVLRYEIAFDRPKTQLHWTDDPALAREIVGGAPPSHDGKWVWIDTTRVSVRVEPIVHVPAEEYIRLWASYEAKIIFNLGYNPQSAEVALNALELAALDDIVDETDCVARLGWREGLRIVDKVAEVHSLYTGEFYARGSVDRMIQTTFPREIDDFQVAISGIALLHHVAVANRGDAHSLCVLTRTARNLATLCASLAQRINAPAAAQMPIRAYLDAVAAC